MAKLSRWIKKLAVGQVAILTAIAIGVDWLIWSFVMSTHPPTSATLSFYRSTGMGDAAAQARYAADLNDWNAQLAINRGLGALGAFVLLATLAMWFVWFGRNTQTDA